MDFDRDIAVATAIGKKTEAELALEAAYQQEQREKLSEMSDMQIRVMQGKRLELLAIEQLKASDAPFEHTRLGEAYALQGRFKDAWWETVDEAKRQEYNDIYQAVLRRSSEHCDCPKSVKTGKHEIPSMFVKDRFYEDEVYRCDVNLWCCSLCGFLNAYP